MAEHRWRLSDEELLAHLKRLYERCGYISGLIINQAEEMPKAANYAQRFGNLHRAYDLVGFHNPCNNDLVEINKRLRQLYPEII